MSLKSSGEIPIKYFRHILSKLGVFLHNYSTGESFTNKIWQDCGYSSEDMSQQKWLDFLHPDDVDRVRNAMEDITDGKTDIYDEIYRIRTKKGDYRWVLSSGDFISREADGSPALYMGADSDITDLKNIEQQLSSALEISKKKTIQTETLLAVGKAVISDLNFQKSIDTILERTGDVIPFDTASVLLIKNKILTVAGIRGWKDDEGKLGEELDLKIKSPYSELIESRKACILNDFSKFNDRNMILHDEKTFSWLGVPLILNDKVLGLLSCNRKNAPFAEEHLQLAEGIAGFIAIALNNAENHEEITKLAVTDSLTGLYTRRWFYENGERLLDQSKRYKWSLAVLMMDLDHFKAVNDDFGHKVGDIVLKATADILKTASRHSDLLCRYGGEEFALILPEACQEDAEQTAERIRSGIEKMSISEMDRSQTISIGISLFTGKQNSSIDRLLDHADKALYRAKDNGRNCWVSTD
jgi:diguanylate cyclase (GGDEF)-like protein/PAS domain S-box-containing protein